jgi:hypothetical protein
MKKTAVNKFPTWAIIIALSMTYSASRNGLILCISEFGHIQIESKISIIYDKNGPAFIDNMQSNIYYSPISGCGSCEDMELSQVGFIRSSTQRYKVYYQTTSSTADIQGSRKYVFNDDISYRFNEYHDLTPGQTQKIVATTILIC